MKTLIAVLAAFSFSSLSAQVELDTMKIWHYLGSQGGVPTSVSTRQVKDTSTGGIYSRAFRVDLLAGTTVFFGRRFDHSYPRPWGITYNKMLNMIDPNDILHITDVGIRVYLHYSDRDTVSMVPLTDGFSETSRWIYTKRPAYRPGTSLPDSIDGIILE